jgi:hypothetical protein
MMEAVSYPETCHYLPDYRGLHPRGQPSSKFEELQFERKYLNLFINTFPISDREIIHVKSNYSKFTGKCQEVSDSPFPLI